MAKKRKKAKPSELLPDKRRKSAVLSDSSERKKMKKHTDAMRYRNGRTPPP